jgi:hypothetical protein
VSLLASATHVVSIGPMVTGPPAVVRTMEARADSDGAPPTGWAPSTPALSSVGLTDGFRRYRRPLPLGSPQQLLLTARPSPSPAACIRWWRAIRSGGSPNGSWVTATAGRSSSPPTRAAGCTTANYSLTPG